VQTRWSSGAIEQHGDARGTRAHVDDDAPPASQLWASGGTSLAHLEAGTDSKSVDRLVSHYRYPASENSQSKKQNSKRRHEAILNQSSMQPSDEMAPQMHASRRDLAAARTPEHPPLAQAGGHGRAGVIVATKHT